VGILKRILVGILAMVGALALLVAIGVAGAAWYLLEEGPDLPDRMVLTLDLRGGIDEIASDDPVSALTIGRQPTLADVVLALDRAGDDERVTGLLARLDGQGPGFAQLQELRDAVTRFRAKGKLAVAHADSFGEFGPGNGGYYLASAFERIELQPMGAEQRIGCRTAGRTPPLAKPGPERQPGRQDRCAGDPGES
jgi:protease-4